MRRKPPRLVRIVRVRLRRAATRMDQNTPEWLRMLTPYGASLSLHGLILAVLAFGFYAGAVEADKDAGRFVSSLTDQLVEDVTTLRKADQSGDPFPADDLAEAPSLTLDPQMVDESATNLPELPPDMLLGRDIRLDSNQSPAPTETPKLAPIGAAGPGGFAGLPTGDGPMTAPFSGRSAQARAKIARRAGGSILSEQSVARGLNWIVRHQQPDGSWSLNHRRACKGAGCPSDKHMNSDAAATGLALLPLLGAGRIHNEPSDYTKNVKGGIDWLIAHQKADGDLFTGGHGQTHMYSHAIAALALTEAFGVSRDEALKAPAQKAIDFIVKAQNKEDGGWRYQPGERGDTCVFGWQMFALRSGTLAGLEVPLETVTKCREYLDRAKGDEYGSTYVYYPPDKKPPTPIMTAEGLLCRQYLGWQRTYPALVVGAEKVFGELQKSFAVDPKTGEVELKSINIYFWYYATQLLHNMQGPYWQQWNVQMRDTLVLTQNNVNGCAKGSWDPILYLPNGKKLEDPWAGEGGRLFMTSMSLMSLEVYYRYLPLYQARDRDSLSSGKEKGEK